MEAQNIENEVAIYSVKGLKPIEVSVANDAVWLTQAQMAQLFLRAMYRSFRDILKTHSTKENWTGKAICIFCKFRQACYII